MVVKEVDELTARVINQLQSGEKKPRDFLKSKNKLKAQGVDVDFVEQGLAKRGLLKKSFNIVDAFGEFSKGLEGNIGPEDVKITGGLPSARHMGYVAGMATLGMTGPETALVQVVKKPEWIKLINQKPNKLYELGNKISSGLTWLRRQDGKRVGEVKTAVREMKGQINTSDIILKAVNDLKDATVTSGKKTISSSLSKSDQSAIKEVIKILSTDGGRPSPKTLLQAKDIIDNRFLTYPSNLKSLSPISDNGSRILKNMRGQIDDLLLYHDQFKELGGTGKLAYVNQRFAKTAEMYDRARSLLGNDFNIGKKALTIGREIAEGNPEYVSLFGELDKSVPETLKFANELDKVVSGIKLSKNLDKIFGVKSVRGGLQSAGEAVKYLGLQSPGLRNKIPQLPVREAGTKLIPSLLRSRND